jgi:hypothetical protein
LPTTRSELDRLDNSFYELFIEQALEKRAAGWSSTVEEAMEKFDRSMSDFESDSDE